MCFLVECILCCSESIPKDYIYGLINSFVVKIMLLFIHRNEKWYRYKLTDFDDLCGFCHIKLSVMIHCFGKKKKNIGGMKFGLCYCSMFGDKIITVRWGLHNVSVYELVRSFHSCPARTYTFMTSHLVSSFLESQQMFVAPWDAYGRIVRYNTQLSSWRPCWA